MAWLGLAGWLAHKVNPKHVHTLFNVVFVKDLDHVCLRPIRRGGRPSSS